MQEKSNVVLADILNLAVCDLHNSEAIMHSTAMIVLKSGISKKA